MYRYFGNFPANPQILSARPYHTSEIREIFGTYNVSLATQEQIEASKYIQDAWAAFAKDPENGLERYGGWVSLSNNDRRKDELLNQIVADLWSGEAHSCEAVL